jgi:serine/threonine protein phosphatase 1
MIIVGDVHGCFETLKKVTAKFPTEQICIVGDLVDRGPQSVDVVQYVMDNRSRISCVKGNHEHMMLEFYRNGGEPRMFDIWLANGGRKVFEEYQRRPELLESHLEFLEALPFYIKYPDLKDDDGRYLVVSHSIITSPDIDLCVKSEAIIWGRYFPKRDPSDGEWFNVYGHTPIKVPIVNKWSANIDTGACFGGYLTTLAWPSLELVMFKHCDKETEFSNLRSLEQ